MTNGWMWIIGIMLIGGFILQMTPLMFYLYAGNILTVTHTKVPDALAGRGIAGKLASAFYEWAIRHHYIVHSECSYMSHWMEKNK